MTAHYDWRPYRPGDEAALRPRPDMAASFEAERGRLPGGRKWTLTRDGRPVGVGGFEPSGAAASMGWWLAEDLDMRGWAAARRASREALDWARRVGPIRRVHVLAAGDRPAACRMLARLGFARTGALDDGDVVMSLEFTR